jgi:hypothetical protein
LPVSSVSGDEGERAFECRAEVAAVSRDLEELMAEPGFAELVAPLGSPVVSAVSLTQLPIEGRRRGCYRLQLANGRTLKYRRMPSAERAETVERLIALIAAPQIPRVLGRHGAGLLFEYVRARPVGRRDLTPKLLSEAASLQAHIHAIDVAGLLPTIAPQAVDRRTAGLRSSIERLVSQDALTLREGEGLWELALSHAPAVLRSDVTHNDFCSRNMLLTPEGGLVIIDNETIGVGPYEFDLARTWYLWPMKPPERAAYLEAYARHHDPSAFATRALFWLIDAMARSALFRLRGQSPTAAVPLRKLRLLLQAGSDSPDPHRL